MKAYCINLVHRSDRRDQFLDEFSKISSFFTELEFVPAVQMKPGWVGCTQSHIKVLELALNQGTEFPFMVFEDDATFVEGFVDGLRSFAEQIPKWPYPDMCLLGGDPQTPMRRVTENVCQVEHIYQTHALMYTSEALVRKILLDAPNIRKIDVYLSEEIYPRYRCYAPIPMLSIQSDGFSDITRRQVNFDGLQQKYMDFII